MKQTWNVLKNILVWLVVALAVGMMIFTVVSVNTFDRADRTIFGYKAFIVLSDSMSKTDFSAGDLVLVTEVDPATLQEGDIIAYQSTNIDNFGETVTHKIRNRTTDANGNPGFVTYGTTTDINDDNIVTYSYVQGKYAARLPGVGKFFQFLKTTPGYLICIFLPFLVLLILQGLNSLRLFRQYKQEQLAEMEEARKKEQAEIDEERKKLEAERAESHRMMQELLALKEQLRPNCAGSASDSEKTAEDNA